MEIAGILIASLSLFISLITIYLNYFKKPDLVSFIGPQILAIYNSSGLCITVPITVANSSPNIGVIRRCSLTITSTNNPNQNWHMTWNSFRRITSDGATWVQKGVTHTIPVIPRSHTTENVQFMWSNGNKSNLVLSEGTYKFRVDFWSTNKKPASYVEHDLYVSKDDAKNLTSTINTQQGTINNGIVYFSLDSETTENKLLTTQEMNTLLCE